MSEGSRIDAPIRSCCFLEARVDGLRVVHRSDVLPAQVARAVERHRANVRLGPRACEVIGRASSVSRVVVSGPGGRLELAVKWNHWRGLRGALSDLWSGSRAARAAAGARRLEALRLLAPETLAIAERRVAGLVRESFLLTRFLAGAEPLPVVAPRYRDQRGRRRALAERLGRDVGRLHEAGLDHADFKHSNLMVREDDALVFIDRDSVAVPGSIGWRQRVRALGQLEAYATDLYPWLPRTDRLRFLRGYLAQAVDLDLESQRGRLVRDVHAYATRRLASWAGRSRWDRRFFPLSPVRFGEEADPAKR